MRTIQARHWLAALACATALHALALVRYDPLAQPSPALEPGVNSISIALGPPPEPEPVAEPEPKPKPQPPPQPKPKPKPKPAPIALPEPAPEPEPVEPTPEPTPAPRTEPEPAPQPAHSSKQAAVASRPTERIAPKAVQPATGGIADTPPDYRTLLTAWLEKHKRYPRRARRLGLQGTVMLYFVIDRSGRVVEWEIRDRSAHRILDDAVAEMIQRANPLPAMPESMQVSKLELTVPVRFSLY